MRKRKKAAQGRFFVCLDLHQETVCIAVTVRFLCWTKNTHKPLVHEPVHQ